ncbi:MAG: hypothetical protein MMC33_005595 [Icmadophila ericetorum]|nr:hypothetical protein [Icmadophila ericetorum]
MATAVDLCIGHGSPDPEWATFLDLDAIDDLQNENSFDELHLQYLGEPLPLDNDVKRIGENCTRVWKRKRKRITFSNVLGESSLQSKVDVPSSIGPTWDSTFDNARACNEFPSKLNTESMPVELLRGNLGLPVDNFTDDMMSQQDDFSSSLPLQRWFNSPPEADPVLTPTFTAAAAQEVDMQRSSKERKLSLFIPCDESSFPRAESTGRANSPRSAYTQGYDSISMSGVSSAASGASNTSSISHQSWTGRRGRKRTKLPPTQKESLSPRKKTALYQCTWCCKSFSRKDTWKRHEESEHCPQKEYVCMLDGPVYSLSGSLALSLCVFCPVINPSDEHLQTHNASSCFTKDVAERSFARRDGLVQHVKLKHNAHVKKSLIDRWARTLRSLEQSKWPCGFCHETVQGWISRSQHIAKHFEAGLDMTSWSSSPRGTAPTTVLKRILNLSIQKLGTASTRFRQRQKEKELEEMATITRLENEVREMIEDTEYYKAERDYFRSLAYSTIGGAETVPRIASPRVRRRIALLGQQREEQSWPMEEQGWNDISNDP